MGALRLNEITRDHIADWIEKRRNMKGCLQGKPLAATTLGNEISRLV